MQVNEPWAVFLDIDRTLTVKNNTVPEQNLLAVSAARAAGHKVYINTGRSWGNIPKNLLDTLEVDGYIAGNGAYIRCGGQELLKLAMPEDVVRSVCRFILADKSLWCVVEGAESVFTVPGGGRINLDKLPEIHSPNDVEKLAAYRDIQAIAAGPFMPEEFIRMFENDLDVIQFPKYADCVIKGCNKALGIKRVLEHTGIPRERTIAIGDSGNDMQMLEYCHVGVAMDNAEQKLKDIADFVTLSNEQAGVAFAIRELLDV